MKERFIDYNFQAKSVRLITQANGIIEAMRRDGYTLTLRQLYYQFVARGLLENKQQNYSRLGDILDKARRAGLVDWNAIEDRTRFLRRIPDYNNPTHFIQEQLDYYAENLWRDQDVYCEVWIEKDALIGVAERPCNEWRVPYFACRGYPSSSELYVAAKRLRQKVMQGKNVFVFYLGDHDPSGLDMTRSNDELLDLFGGSVGINVIRLALNMDQVEELNPPPNPAKETDSRYGEYSATFGEECWELDALPPAYIDRVIREHIEKIVDREKFDANLAAETANRDRLREISENINSVARYLKYRNTAVDTEDHRRYLTPDDLIDWAEKEDVDEG